MPATVESHHGSLDGGFWPRPLPFGRWPTAPRRPPDACDAHSAATSLRDRDRLDNHRIGRPVAAVGGRGGDGVDDLLRLRIDNLTEDRVPTVQVRRLADRDEEL